MNFSALAEDPDMALPVTFDRPFILDCIAATHMQVLLSSDYPYSGSDRVGARIEVLFKAVYAAKLNSSLESLTIRVPTDRERSEIELKCGRDIFVKRKVLAYVVESGEFRGYVVALAAYLAVIDPAEEPQPVSLLYDIEFTNEPRVVYRLR